MGLEKLLAPKDAGAILGVSTERVQQLDRAGKLHAVRDSAGRRLLRKSDVLRCKAARERAQREKQRVAAARELAATP